MKKEFRSVSIDTENKTFTILDGSEGCYPFDCIEKCSVLNEEASFRGKSAPFTHQMIGGATTFIAIEPKLYVGIRIKTKDGNELAIYVSEKPVVFNSDFFRNDQKEAETIKRILTK